MYIKTLIKKSIGYLNIDRPESLNAMNDEVLDEFISKINDFTFEPTIRAIIISGSGYKAFIAGADIKLMQQMDSKNALNFAEKGHRLTKLIEHSKKPIIAAINGYAFGGGTEIALACHLRVASEDAIFSISEARWGVMAGIIIPHLNASIGVRNVRRYALTCERFNASQAKEMGLVHQVCSCLLYTSPSPRD